MQLEDSELGTSMNTIRIHSKRMHATIIAQTVDRKCISERANESQCDVPQLLRDRLVRVLHAQPLQPLLQPRPPDARAKQQNAPRGSCHGARGLGCGHEVVGKHECMGSAERKRDIGLTIHGGGEVKGQGKIHEWEKKR